MTTTDSAPPPEAPGEIIREVGFDRHGNRVDVMDPRVHTIEVTYRDRDTGDEMRTYLTTDAAGAAPA